MPLPSRAPGASLPRILPNPWNPLLTVLVALNSIRVQVSVFLLRTERYPLVPTKRIAQRTATQKSTVVGPDIKHLTCRGNFQPAATPFTSTATPNGRNSRNCASAPPVIPPSGGK